MVEIDAALQMWLKAAPDIAHPGDMRRRLRAIGPLSNGIEIPLRPPGGEGGFGHGNASASPVHVEENQCTQR
jgi:hypothetical protein